MHIQNSGGTVKDKNVTYLELKDLCDNSGLKVGQRYCITNFRTRHLIPNTVSYNVGVTEPLVVIAVSVDALDKLAESGLYPQDILYYELEDSSGEGGDRGRIYFRHDTKLNISMWEDWRNIKYRRWQTGPGGDYTVLTANGEAYVDRYMFNNSQLAESCYDIFIEGDNNLPDLNWNPGSIPAAQWYHTDFGGGRIVAVSGDRKSAYSDDGGYTWKAGGDVPLLDNIQSVFYFKKRWFAVGYGVLIAYSDDGAVSWGVASIMFGSWSDITGLDDVLFTTGKHDRLGAYSLDRGNSWTQVLMGDTTTAWYKVAAGNGAIVSVNNGEALACYSLDKGVTWVNSAPIVFVNPDDWTGRGLAYGDGVFVMVGGTTPGGTQEAAYSEDNGATWIVVTLPIKVVLREVTYGDGRFIATGDSNVVLYSDDKGKTWYQMSALLPVSQKWYGVVYSIDRFVVLGQVSGGNGTVTAYSLWNAATKHIGLSNTIFGNNCVGNRLEKNVIDCTIGDRFQFNKVKVNFVGSTLGSGFDSNEISSYVHDCVFPNDFQYNKIFIPLDTITFIGTVQNKEVGYINSNFNVPIVISNLTTLDITINNSKFVGIVEVDSSNATESINLILNQPDRDYEIKPASDLTLTITGTSFASINANGQILLGAASRVLAGNKRDSIKLRKETITNGNGTFTVAREVGINISL